MLNISQKGLKVVLISILYFSILLLFPNISFAAINLAVSPIKYEIEAQTGTTITRDAKLINKGTSSINIITGKSDFQANGISGKPQFVRRSELVFLDQQLSSWITLSSSGFIINPGETKIISFTINIPDNATPGGHYGAIFFKNNNSEVSSSGKIGINVDYGVLILLNVEGEIITSVEVDDPIITGGGGDGGGWGNIKDDCLIDLTASNYDGLCVDNPLEDNITDSDKKNDDIENNNFDVLFEFLFKNTGNTHVKPKGKIKLVDEDGNNIKGIGEEIIKNDLGAIIGKKIVDYLPINDNGGNILPDTKRKFDISWKGFPFQDFNEKGEKIINYWTPSEYYTKKNIEKRKFLMFRERVCEKNQNKKITAFIDISYKDSNGEDVEFNSSKDFNINYTEEYIGLNPYVIIPFILIFLLPLLFFIILFIKRKRKKECIKCKKLIGKNWDICPYCSKKQTKKKK